MLLNIFEHEIVFNGKNAGLLYFELPIVISLVAFVFQDTVNYDGLANEGKSTVLPLALIY
jgi:hypothetical protein